MSRPWNSAGVSPWSCSAPFKMASTEPTMVPTLARLSTKSMAASRGPAMPRDRTMVVIKVSMGKLPPV